MTWQQSAVFTFVLVNAFVFGEWLASLAMRRRVYSLKGTLTNIADYTVYLVIAAIYGYSEYLLLTWLQLEFAVQKLPATWWYWLLLFLADDFCFYWFHRASHKLGLLWMSHVVHHSSNEFNLSVGLRQTWLPFLGIVFWLPLAFAGFAPEHILLRAGDLTQLPVFDAHATRKFAAPSGADLQHTVAPPRAPRHELRIPRQKFRGSTHRVG
jgi:sterol desaturase/sphingolipid hydroxylase (fatty acid hydroxylase superfamily)